MDSSFELLSSMSPKINKHIKPGRKPPTMLALKKYFRRPSNVYNANNSMKNESIITIESSCAGSSSESKNSHETPIVISDSEISFSVDKPLSKNSPRKELNNKTPVHQKSKHDDTRRLSQEKYTKIKLWVDEVNSVKHNTSVFSQVSTVYGDDNSGLKLPATNIAASSTFLEPTSKRFDELFNNKQTAKPVVNHGSDSSDENFTDNVIEDSFCKKKYTPSPKSHYKDIIHVINDSLITEDESLQKQFSNISIHDSFQLTLDESPRSRTKKDQLEENNSEQADLDDSSSDCNSDEYGDLLDSLYGDSWREKKEDVLPSSEPRPKKKERKVDKKLPNTERRSKVSKVYKNQFVENEQNSNNLLKTLQRARFQQALESPWKSHSLKNLCDSDTDSDDSANKLPPTRLNFKDDQDIDGKKKYKDSSDKVQIKTVNANVDVTTKKTKPSVKQKENKIATGCCSFLASLSGSVPVSKCDMSALIYRNNFKQHKEQLASKLFKLYNENIFENAIPGDTPIEWNDRMRGTAGNCSCRKITRRTGAIERAVKIVLSNKVLDSADRLRDTLVHEMCHAATWIVNQVTDGHGPFWKSWAARAMKTFPELPPIKRCHQYIINTKYTYKCTSCGYSIGRHTKSLDTERKRCGYCYGKFEVLINKTSKKGETRSVPVTPKKPATGFALFVKENYATYKTPQLKHGDVMKILGQKFTNLKFDEP